jgi:hypothetical protein
MVNENLGNELYTKLNDILDDIATLPVSGLGWLFVWDNIRDVVQDIQLSIDGDSTYGEYVMAPGVDLKKVWDVLWDNPWGGFDTDSGHVLDWLVEQDLIQEYEEEGE